ncbi:efflux RND transporter periplasmic adaptor subunit [Acuticoccus sediminis]|uniref:efflux RND transporter periplasmic adaptor subunit n=1 Tax=Acuticoccus sediminis TaxID=2184697 RepID=UPI001CFF2E5B|nr:efflux RND transporter periplasmic adaptor subunit [Acuticoccus sediminis]
MTPTRRRQRLTALTVGLLTLLPCAMDPGDVRAQPMPPGGMGAPGPREVGVIEMKREEVPYVVTVPGRAVAYEQVDIRPRVGGIVSEVVYTAGRPVKVGDLLFRIEDETYAAEVAADEAAVKSAEAQLSAKKAQVERYTRLEGTGVTRADVQTAEVEVAEAEATLGTARADLRLSRLNLERTEITSPIEGVPSVPNVSVGAVVTANQSDALTTVTRIDPIYVDVAESSARIGRVRASIDSGTLTMGEHLDLHLTLENGEAYDRVGEIVSPGVLVSTTTGTTDIRVRFPNPDRLIMPGQFLRVDAVLGTTEAILVPQGATSRTAEGLLTAFVARDGKAARVTLTTTGSYKNAWIVTDGIAVGDELIVDGLTNLLPGAEVTTVPVTISDDGVVSDALPATGEGASSPVAGPGAAGASATRSGR